MKKIALFASGSGTNVENIATFFRPDKTIQISRIYCNNPTAFVLERAKKLDIPAMIFSKDDFYSSARVLKQLKNDQTDLIVLAGFLWLIPKNILENYHQKIINIHPALLPKYGGKGMYGSHVHEAVIASGDRKSGISIHYVNEKYDDGAIIFQASCDIEKNETPETLASKIHKLEHEHFPRVIKTIISS